MDDDDRNFDIILEYQRIREEFGEIVKERLEALGWTIDEDTKFREDLAKKTESGRYYNSNSMSFSRDLFKLERDLRAENNPAPKLGG